MTLEDFEKSLGEGRKAAQSTEKQETGHRKHRHRHGHHQKRKHHEDDTPDCHKHKRARLSTTPESDGDGKLQRNSSGRMKQTDSNCDSEGTRSADRGRDRGSFTTQSDSKQPDGLQRDSWMQMPSGSDVEFTHKATKHRQTLNTSRPSGADFQLKIHDSELNKHHLQDLANGEVGQEHVLEEPTEHEVNYVFGDAGSQWRMTKLKAVFRHAEESGKPVEAIAVDRFGGLRAFDDAREEQIELDRRETYGSGYVGKEKPSGDLFAERHLDAGIRRTSSAAINDGHMADTTETLNANSQSLASKPAVLDHTALNRLKARMMKAKLRGANDAAGLEAEYNAALDSSKNSIEPEIVVLGAMNNRMLAGGRNNEVKNVSTRRGRERGLVEENEDMSIEDSGLSFPSAFYPLLVAFMRSAADLRSICSDDVPRTFSLCPQVEMLICKSYSGQGRAADTTANWW